MMALVDTQTREVEIPHEPGNVVVVRPLRGSELRAAEAVTRREALASVAGMPKEALDQARQAAEDRKAKEAAQGKQEEAKAADLADTYDIGTVVAAGLVTLKGPLYDAAVVEAGDDGSELAARLDAATERVAFDAIMEGSVVPPA